MGGSASGGGVSAGNGSGAPGGAGSSAAAAGATGDGEGGSVGAAAGSSAGGAPPHATAGSAGNASGAGNQPMAGAGGAAGGAAGSAGCDFAVLDPSKPPQMLQLSGSVGTHDPVVIEADGIFYMFHTGNNIGAKTSTDLRSWKNAPTVFTNATRPAWLAQQVPAVESNLWAPDISRFGGQYHLYYSVSSFSSNRSCIGHLTRPSLATGSWTDRGPVICSNTTSTKENWNAIDPNVVIDEAGTPWLSFGSFWSGIKLIQLDQAGARVGTSLESLANRPNDSGAVEAPFIVRRCDYYYLFVSWDSCCKGVSSTYNLRVGRSKSVKGPYVDRDGKSLLEGGGTLLVQGNSTFHGPGHNAVLFTATAAYNIFHAYDAPPATLRISELAFGADGWPVSAGP